MVQFRGKSVVATTWKHYKAEKDTNGRSKADEVEEGFWVMKNVQIIYAYALYPWIIISACTLDVFPVHEQTLHSNVLFWSLKT